MRAGGGYVDRFHAMVRIVEELGADALSELSTTVEWAPGLGGLTNLAGTPKASALGGMECGEIRETPPASAGGGITRGADGREGAAREGPNVGDDYIYSRDMHWLDRADALVAEVSAPSLGVGYEVSCALHVRKIPVLCLVHAGVRNLSAMISGNASPGLRLARYRSENEMREVIERFLADLPMP